MSKTKKATETAAGRGPRKGASTAKREKPTSRAAVPRPARVSEAKKPKSYRLSEAKIERARKLLGAPTATAAIEEALDMVVFRSELLHGAAALRGMRFAEVDEDAGSDAAKPKRRAGG